MNNIVNVYGPKHVVASDGIHMTKARSNTAARTTSMAGDLVVPPASHEMAMSFTHQAADLEGSRFVLVKTLRRHLIKEVRLVCGPVG
jgi:hypothetical protein